MIPADGDAEVGVYVLSFKIQSSKQTVRQAVNFLDIMESLAWPHCQCKASGLRSAMLLMKSNVEVELTNTMSVVLTPENRHPDAVLQFNHPQLLS